MPEVNSPKRIIFHIPFVLNPYAKSASGIRPIKMLEAFRNIGYDVDVIAGTATQRKKLIHKIQMNITNGVRYEFCYSESSTQPMLHTEPYGFIKHPFFEFNFFRFLNRHKIKIGLFYRDIYWCFSENVDTWKKRFYRYLYKYDIRQYKKYVDTLFVPSVEMMDYVKNYDNSSLYELPSGADTTNCNNHITNEDGIIRVFYVGGIGNHYDLSMAVKVIKDFPNIHLTLCCREDEWNKVKHLYTPLSHNISVIHKSGKDIEELYSYADLGLLFVAPTVYWAFAMPYKLLEFIGYGLPVLTTNGTKTGQFVKENDCGYVVDYDIDSLKDFFLNLNIEKLHNKRNKVLSFAPTQSWNKRAETVIKVLTK